MKITLRRDQLHHRGVKLSKQQVYDVFNADKGRIGWNMTPQEHLRPVAECASRNHRVAKIFRRVKR